MSDTCRNCGAVLPEGDDVGGLQPCPTCGQNAGRIMNLSLNSKIPLSQSALWNGIPGHTGREVTGAQAYDDATEWASLQTRAELLNHSASRDFSSLIRNAACLTDDKLSLFRGRGVDGPAPTPEQMGPPPLGKPTEGGRYDKPGDHVLYLSDSEDGNRREYERWYKTGSPYIQRFRLPLDKLRIADFTGWPPDHLVTAVFSKAEDCNVAGRGPNCYVFSQAVAELVAAHFDGMRIPGVGGAPGAHYSNVVMFRPYPDWPAWLEAGAIPYQALWPGSGGS